MNNIEVIICLVLLFMAVPDACRRLGRPALAFPAFVVFGLLLGPIAPGGVRVMLHQAGQVGFLLLLFEVGLEIDIPRPSLLLPALRFAARWALVQYPIIFAFAYLAGLKWIECFVAATALTGCSVGMAHPAWKSYPGLDPRARDLTLRIMVVLETMAIVLFAIQAAGLSDGFGWAVFLKLAGIAITLVLIARSRTQLTRLFQTILDRTTRWRVHFLVLLVLSICAVGQRLGLDAAKTAFFLGLFLSNARHDGLRIEDAMAPISRRFLIPVFFVALGLEIDWRMLLDPTAFLALVTAATLLLSRDALHRLGCRSGGDSRAFLLLCPNLTMVALGSKMLFEHGAIPHVATWLLLTGLFLTITAISFLPATPQDPPKSAADT